MTHREATGSLCEFRCRQCDWVDTRPDKCTRCGSLRGEKPSLWQFLRGWPSAFDVFRAVLIALFVVTVVMAVIRP